MLMRECRRKFTRLSAAQRHAARFSTTASATVLPIVNCRVRDQNADQALIASVDFAFEICCA
jgi:hypothetical protein